MLFRFTAFALSSSLLCTATTWHDIGPVIMDATVKATGLIHEASSMPDSGATPGQILDVYTEIVEVAHAYHSARIHCRSWVFQQTKMQEGNQLMIKAVKKDNVAIYKTSDDQLATPLWSWERNMLLWREAS
ncbi:hypothetical protein C8J56DRAFT_891007 [Mycena floridula]|nr:hypothetical protein C8J56DRAFT_891007 [Mycena floridula]